MDELQLQLTVDEINRILQTLGERPYREVFELIRKIQGQAEAQLSENGQPQPGALAGQSPTQGG